MPLSAAFYLAAARQDIIGDESTSLQKIMVSITMNIFSRIKQKFFSNIRKLEKHIPFHLRLYFIKATNKKIISVICVKNEEQYLEDFFSYLRNYVDGFIVLDDGSTDRTTSIIKSEEKVLSLLTNPPHGPEGWDEPQNRIRVLTEAKKFGDIVLCCDADERFEEAFLKNLRKIATLCIQNKQTAYGVHFRELWESYDHYRSDGIWNTKKKEVIFHLNNKMTFAKTMFQRHHIPWYHDDIQETVLLNYNLYHLKMIKREDRIKSVFGNFSFYSYKKACGQKKTVRGSKNSRRLSNGTPAI